MQKSAAQNVKVQHNEGQYKVRLSQDISVQHNEGQYKVGLGQDRLPASAGF